MQQQESEGQPDHLALEKIDRVVKSVSRQYCARAEHHDEADQREDHGGYKHARVSLDPPPRSLARGRPGKRQRATFDTSA